MSSWLKVMAREQSWGRGPGGLVRSLSHLAEVPHPPAYTTSSVPGAEYKLEGSRSPH